MASITVIDVKSYKILNFISVVNDKIEHSLYKIENRSEWSEESIQQLKNAGVGYDIKESKSRLNTDAHWHSDSEGRLILSGGGIFYLPIENELYEVEVGCGDYVWLAPKVIHWFNGSDHLLALRFFENSLVYKSYTTEIPIWIKQLKSNCAVGLKYKI